LRRSNRGKNWRVNDKETSVSDLGQESRNVRWPQVLDQRHCCTLHYCCCVGIIRGFGQTDRQTDSRPMLYTRCCVHHADNVTTEQQRMDAMCFADSCRQSYTAHCTHIPTCNRVAEKLEGFSNGLDTDPTPFPPSVPFPYPIIAPPLFHTFHSLLLYPPPR